MNDVVQPEKKTNFAIIILSLAIIILLILGIIYFVHIVNSGIQKNKNTSESSSDPSQVKNKPLITSNNTNIYLDRPPTTPS
jgi:flagellar basal body-associated protein FliL